MPFVFPNPSGDVGISIYSTSAYIIFLGFEIVAKSSSRKSGTFATPTLGLAPLDLKEAVSACPLVTALKIVVFPDCGRPNIPIAKGEPRGQTYDPSILGSPTLRF